MKITIIDQTSGSIHEVSATSAETKNSNDFCWFDPDSFLKTSEDIILSEEDEVATTKRIRFTDGKEIEVNPNTGDLLGV